MTPSPPKPCKRGCGARVIVRRRAERTDRWIALDANTTTDSDQVRHVEGINAYLPDQHAEATSPANTLAFERSNRTAYAVHAVHACGRPR